MYLQASGCSTGYESTQLLMAGLIHRSVNQHFVVKGPIQNIDCLRLGTFSLLDLAFGLQQRLSEEEAIVGVG